ncbi:hypothetical protein BJD20_17940 [Acinetobacter proteolyticus]|uniref:hypothetical protein n=1 Tax=Acinetobacter proteolyticus TaxID=1776741 RepID=UPI0008633F0A|nr:hypothetical protein [Acinetobacter proteolyticus]OEY94925.1 hypothetical protein BJD20_17940 [Acinetobacter proteolyticus]
MIKSNLLDKIIKPCIDFKEKLESLIKGYGFVPISYYADSKKEIAHKILPILRSYRKLIIKKDNISLPTWVVDSKYPQDFSDDELNYIWLDYLNKMILAFELVLAGNHSTEAEKQIEEGLRLFTSYYQHLWD